MKIEILGTRGEIIPFSAYHKRHSGVLIDDYILLDLGEMEFLKYQPQYIFITHLHADHAFFVNNNYVKKWLKNASIYLPERPVGLTLGRVMHTPLQLSGYKITPIPTRHSLKVKSQGYLIESEQERIFYTGDLIGIDKKYHNLLCNLDVVITEASFIRRNGLIRRNPATGKLFGHAGLPNLIAFFSNFTSVIVLTHFGSWFFVDQKKAKKRLVQLGREYQTKVVIAYDGMRFETKNIETSTRLKSR